MSKIEVNEIARRSGSSPISIPGHVIQVQTARIGDANGITTTSTSYVDVGLQVSITPTSASSKIYIIYSTSLYCYSGGADVNASVSLARNVGGGSFTTLEAGTDVASSSSVYIHNGSGGGNPEIAVRYADNFEDSPNTTSACIYKVQGAIGAGGSARIGSLGNTNSSIIAMEIAQ
tara:strand:+ start:487 stop:1011 length:525 start_codon:yes stop_codon:yes gene_type:complete